MLGVTSEPSSATEKFAEETGMRYAYGYEKSQDLMRKLGVRGYPTAVLVDPGGTVVWKGHPSALDDDIVAGALTSAFATPLWEWPKSGKSARKALARRQYGKALQALTRLEDPWAAEARGNIMGMATSWTDSLEKALEVGDYLTVKTGLGLAKDRVGGLEALEQRVEVLEETFKGAKDARHVVKLQKKLADLLETRINSKNDVLDLIEELEEFGEKAAGTYAGQEAAEHIERLREMLR